MPSLSVPPLAAGEDRRQRTALLLFCPTPTNPADEAAWRLLGHLLQAPFYQRLRVELQLGYAVFSGIRQVNGQTGLCWRAIPSVALAAIVDHLRILAATAFDRHSDDLGNDAWRNNSHAGAARRPSRRTAVARAPGRPSVGLPRAMQQQSCPDPQDLQHAAQQLQDAAGGWRCLANGPRIDDTWRAH
jgi:hypothetical protein